MLKEDIPKDDLEKEIENIAEKASMSSNEDLAKSVAEQISNPAQKYECIVSDYPILSPHEFHEVQVKSSKYVACFKVRKYTSFAFLKKLPAAYISYKILTFKTCTITEPVISGFWNINFTLCSGPQAEGKSAIQMTRIIKPLSIINSSINF